MDAWNRLRDLRGKEGQERDWLKEGGEISQRTYMYNPLTQTAVSRWQEGWGVGTGWRRAKGEVEMEISVIMPTIKNKEKIIKISPLQ